MHVVLSIQIMIRKAILETLMY